MIYDGVFVDRLWLTPAACRRGEEAMIPLPFVLFMSPMAACRLHVYTVIGEALKPQNNHTCCCVSTFPWRPFLGRVRPLQGPWPPGSPTWTGLTRTSCRSLTALMAKGKKSTYSTPHLKIITLLDVRATRHHQGQSLAAITTNFGLKFWQILSKWLDYKGLGLT